MKIKIGQPTLDEDVTRANAVRELIGPKIAFMVDANCSMNVDGAIAAARALKPCGIYWFEEPIIPDDYRGVGRIVGSTDVPIAMGKTCTPFTDSNMPSLTPSWRSFGPMRPTAVASPAGCGWRHLCAATGFPSVATGCMNCM